jgi:hypothetical protein
MVQFRLIGQTGRNMIGDIVSRPNADEDQLTVVAFVWNEMFVDRSEIREGR